MKILRKGLPLLVVIPLASLPLSQLMAQSVEVDAEQSEVVLEVFKDPACGCCKSWVAHLKKGTISARVRNHSQASLNQLKAKLGIPARLSSCHTGVSEGGYFFEGHIPAKFISAFLANPPDDAIGLATPGMPVGSPGMEAGQRFQTYQVTLLKKDGSTEVYATVNSIREGM